MKLPEPQTLTHDQLYLFDAMGVLKVPGFLSREAAAECRSEILQQSSRLMEGRGDKERFDDLFEQSPALRDLANSAAVRNCVEPLINQPYRLIESYGLRRHGDSVFYLHNGNSEILEYGDGKSVQRNMSLHHSFQDGKIFCMFVKLLVYLSDVRAVEDGPFCYLQGSHKANLPLFPTSEDFDARPPLTKANFPSLEHLFAEAGDAVLINEALFHGTLPKSSPSERLVMALSFAPAFVADWSEIDRDSDDLRKLGHY